MHTQRKEPRLDAARETVLLARDIISRFQREDKVSHAVYLSLQSAVMQVCADRVGASNVGAIVADIQAAEARTQLAAEDAAHSSSSDISFVTANSHNDNDNDNDNSDNDSSDNIARTNITSAAHVLQKIGPNTASPNPADTEAGRSPAVASPGQVSTATTSRFKPSFSKDADGLITAATFDLDVVGFHESSGDRDNRR